jgi:hypothetical protein
MATGPCQAGFAETHNYIYLGGIESEDVAGEGFRFEENAEQRLREV